MVPFRKRRAAALAIVPAAALLAATAVGAVPGQAAERPSERQSDRRVERSGPPASDRFEAVPIVWGACDPDDFYTLADGTSLLPPTYQCADYQVPLDYDRPRGEQITLALIRRPADDPDAAGGTIFSNPGGPGGSGVELVAYGGEGLFGPEVLAEFDLVGMDPRGIAGSTPLQCYPDNETVIADLVANELQAPWPVTDAEWAAARADARDLATDCRANAGPIIDHMGTTNVARDLDVLRRAVGDEQLNFIGYSYGTYVCAQYITQYPRRAGAVVCDANVDPVEWATGEPPGQGFFVPNFARGRHEVGANATLEEFFRLCDADGAECAFAPDSRARFFALADRLKTSPLDLGGLAPFDDRALVANSLQPLYNSPFGFPYLAGFLAEVEALAAGGVPAVQPVEPEIVPPVNEAYYNLEGQDGVLCSDNLHPRHFGAWRSAVADSEGVFGPFWSFFPDHTCARWPGYDTDSSYGPFTRQTRSPVLIVSTTFDPATPYEDAVAHQALLPNSALLTVEGWGHVGQGLSDCGDTIIDRYMLTRAVPSEFMTCTQDLIPFTPVVTDPLTAVAAEPTEPTGAEETVLDDAVDAALAELGDSGDATAANEAATRVIVEALDEAGQTELADDLRTRQAILSQTLRPAAN